MDDYIKIEKAENGGFVVTMCDADGGDNDMGPEDKTYVYANLDEALKEIPGLFSILDDGDDNGASDVKEQINQKPMGTTKREMKAKGY